MRTLLNVVLVAILGLWAAGCGEEAGEPAAEDAAAGPVLPYLDMAALDGLIAEAAARDKVLVVDFWATWCDPCVKMFPALHTGLEAMGEDVVPVTVTLDSPDRMGLATAFLEQQHAMEGAYMLVPDSDQQVAIGERWQVLAVPAILVFDQDGELAGGFRDGEVQPILQRVRALLRPDDAAPQPTTAANPANEDVDHAHE